MIYFHLTFKQTHFTFVGGAQVVNDPGNYTALNVPGSWPASRKVQ